MSLFNLLKVSKFLSSGKVAIEFLKVEYAADYSIVSQTEDFIIKERILENPIEAYYENFSLIRETYYKRKVTPQQFLRDCEIIPVEYIHIWPIDYECNFEENIPYKLKINNLTAGPLEVYYKNSIVFREDYIDGGATDGVGNIILSNSTLYIEYSQSSSSGTMYNIQPRILKVSESVVEIIKDSYFPLLINNKLIYFKKVDDQMSLAVDEDEVKELNYDEIHFYRCCEASINSIYVGQESLDFFAQKNNKWRHVVITFK
ncbi:MAG TPA: hypothetical protein VGA67_01555 [Candidatus Dojkabacteria bacterium]